MNIRKASPADLPMVGFITRRTIQEVYPRYYPHGAVEFFLDWHKDKNILPDIEAGEVYLLFDGGMAAGTVTLHGEEITRLYVQPGLQGRGYGRALLDFAERAIGERYGKIRLEASLPAAAIYWKRGYRVTDMLTETQERGDMLCWDVMEKTWGSAHAGRDWELFCEAGLSHLYETIGDYNLFMACEKPDSNAFRELPPGYSIRPCGRDELDLWANTAVEKQYVPYVLDYYKRVYAKNEDEFFRRCLLIWDESGGPAGTCLTWPAYRRVNTIGWFRVLPEHEGRGLGWALLTEILRETDMPIYLHTQPTSVCAIKLYSDMGFRFVTCPDIGRRKNDLDLGLPVLRRVMDGADYERLGFTDNCGALHEAALYCEQPEF